jgi:hypothetical protein
VAAQSPETRRGSTITVSVVRTGGVAGARREWRLKTRGDDVEQLVEQLDAMAWETVAIDPGSRDRFVWKITVTGAARHRVTLPDAQVTGPWRELVERVQSDGETVTAARTSPRAEKAG